MSSDVIGTSSLSEISEMNGEIISGDDMSSDKSVSLAASVLVTSHNCTDMESKGKVSGLFSTRLEANSNIKLSVEGLELTSPAVAQIFKHKDELPANHSSSALSMTQSPSNSHSSSTASQMALIAN